jgi:hypothetical protein
MSQRLSLVSELSGSPSLSLSAPFKFSSSSWSEFTCVGFLHALDTESDTLDDTVVYPDIDTLDDTVADSGQGVLDLLNSLA